MNAEQKRLRNRIVSPLLGYSLEELASFEVLLVTENFKRTLVKNGGLVLGRLLEAQGNYRASVSRRGDKARFRVQSHVDGGISRIYGLIMCHVSFYVERKYPNNIHRHNAMSYIVRKMCEELGETINKEVQKAF